MGGAGIIPLSAYTQSALDSSVALSSAGVIAAGNGSSIAGSLCIGSDGISVGGELDAGYITPGFYIVVGQPAAPVRNVNN